MTPPIDPSKPDIDSPSSRDPERKGVSGYAKGGIYMGLAFVTPISGYIGYLFGQWLAPKMGIPWLDTAGMMVGCGIGMYETFRQAMRVEGLDRRK